MHKWSMLRWSVILVVALVAAIAWASDQITLQGERTIFTVNCEGGDWIGDRCTGSLLPGKRYAFRASRSRQEVSFWIRGSGEPSGRYSDCRVTNRDNWTCITRADQPRSITTELVNGRPTQTGSNLSTPIHAVSKWKWYLMQMGIGHFRDAD